MARRRCAVPDDAADEVARPLGDWMLGHPGLCKLSTFASLATELALPILILSWWQAQRARGLAVLASTLLQLGIFLMMRVGTFTAGMMVIALALVPPSWFDRIAPAPADTDAPLFGRFAAPIAVVLGFQLFLVVCSELLPSCPAIIETELQYIGLNQGVDLFTRPIPIASWHAEGTLADGRSLDIIPIVAPELEPPVGWWFSRWHKFTFKGSHPLPRARRLSVPALRRGRGRPEADVVHAHARRHDAAPPGRDEWSAASRRAARADV